MSGSPSVTFLSGWAGYPALLPRVAARTRFVQPFAELDADGALAEARKGGDVLAAWSTGAHLALKHRDELFPLYRRVLLFAPFLNFCVHVKRDVVESMLATVSEEGPRRTVRAFWRTCGARGVGFEPPEGHGGRLADGLRYLLASHAAMEPGEEGGKVRIVHGASDRVVPVAAGGEIAAMLRGSWYSIMDFGHLPDERVVLDILHEETGSDAFQ